MSDTELVGTLDQLLAKKHSQQPFPAALLERPSTPSSFATPPSSPSAALPSSPSQPSLSASIPQTSRQGRALSPSLPPLASPSAPYLPPTVAPLQAPRDRGPQSSREGDYLRRLGSDAGTGEPQRAPARPGRVGSEESSDETARLLESAGQLSFVLARGNEGGAAAGGGGGGVRLIEFLVLFLCGSNLKVSIKDARAE